MCNLGWKVRWLYLVASTASERAAAYAAYMAHVRACEKCMSFVKGEWAK